MAKSRGSAGKARWSRLLLALACSAPLVVCGDAAAGKAPPNQGRVCDAHRKCEGGLKCAARAERNSTCELLCERNAQCPEDQRCVKDGPQRVCRPINDALEL
jgi:hypothetical protein